MTQSDEWKWMISKLSGNSSQEEDDLLSSWIQSSRQNKVLFDEVSKIWANSGIQLQLKDPTTEEEWKKLQDQIQNDKKSRWITLPKTWLAAAASVIMLAGAVYYLIPAAKTDPETIPIVEKQEQKEITAKPADTDIYITATSKVMTIKLPDGSQVWMNANSTLSYPLSFKTDRVVTLTGEAYFMVTPDKKHPFSVHTHRVSTLVVGTSFNVKEMDSTVSVTVSHGMVKMTDNKGLKEIVLNAKENGTYENGKLIKTSDNLSTFAAWREKNNPSYEQEKSSPSSYLKNNYSWKKNQINRSVIEGSLTNNASLATYHRVVLKATYMKPKGKKEITVRIPIEEPIRPGQTVSYHKKLLDILTHTQSFKVEIEKAEVIPNQYF